jgi:hypothetical protein
MAPQPYDPATGLAWKVIDTKTLSGPDATGRYVPGYQITYQLKSGHAGTVFVPKAAATQEAVAAAITADAQVLAGIANLSQGM